MRAMATVSAPGDSGVSIDQLWHWGTSSGVLGIAAWLLKNAYAAGRKDQKLSEMVKRVDDLKSDIMSRLDRIETLLMEKKS
jgi:hypothetical protein